jgi:amino acid transporter
VLAYKDIQLSSILMLLLEGASVGLILLLCWVVLYHHSFKLDTAQLSLNGASFSGISLGVVTAIFSLVGFECATAFGEEAKNPLKTIPRAVIFSLILTGLFFVIVTYTEVLGFAGYKTTLDKVDAPLNVLAELVSMPWLKAPVSLGAMVSFFSLALSCLNSGARILYPMARHGMFPAAMGNAHETNETPHVAVTVMAALIFLVPSTMLLLFGMQILDVFNDAGTFGAFGFLGAYFLISLAAPAYLRKSGIRRGRDMLLAGASVALLLVPAVGSVYPVPSWPVNVFPYIFGAYLMVGIAWIFTVHRRTPGYSAAITRRVYSDHGQPLEDEVEVAALAPQRQAM